ncbi:MAG: tRNA (adenosine(37)-N6)-threonylcarbamoyltransferase complex transferase subunit TsaD [Chloroherpetonaceae bacterium]|nr:tRNA (adenosine(37)-N6)-threonylcarbamoyltransferase complex transferase subunit TsaD [Chloroherpetonaceae bacterium]
MKILGLETSCDETSAAVLIGGKVVSNLISSQALHQLFGGVVPELASREHERLIVPITQQALEAANIQKSELDFIAATAGPGLIGAVMVGLNFAQALAFALRKPFVPINHIEAHIFSTFIDDGTPDFSPPHFPFLSLIVSGGHTLLAIVQEDLSYEVVGHTIDDAAGEAFDKTGKMLGLGYPAGAAMDKLAQQGDPHFHRFPRAMMTKLPSNKSQLENFHFSFSGLKTSVQTFLRSKSTEFLQTHLADICASIQAAIVDVLVEKTLAAAETFGIRTLSIAGGVSANSALRAKFKAECAQRGLSLHIPKPIFSTDNAAMIAMLAHLKVLRGQYEPNRYNTRAFASFFDRPD